MITTHHGDCTAILPTLASGSVQSVITSPPYWGLRSYLPDGHPLKTHEIGQEPVPDCLAWARGAVPCGDCYVCALRVVFAQIWRVLRDDGTLWVNVGDAYANDRKWGGQTSGKHARGLHGTSGIGRNRHLTGLPSKSLIGLPWRVALALQADGWTLRNEIIWHKRNPMPERVEDRCARDHEPIYLFSKQERYYFDHIAIQELAIGSGPASFRRTGSRRARSLVPGQHGTHRPDRADGLPTETRNARTVWSLACGSYDGEHYATFPAALVERCLLAGTSPQACECCSAPWARVVEKEFIPQEDVGDAAGRRKHLDPSNNWEGVPRGTNRITTIGWRPTCRCAVLDPFAGSGTTGRVAMRLRRHAVLIELNEDYLQQIERRTDGVQLTMVEVLP